MNEDASTPSDLTAEIEALKALLKRNEARSQEFIARLAHELRGPLGVILMWGHVLRSGNDSDRIAALDAIDASARAQSKMIGHVLDVSRGLAGRLRIGSVPIDVREPFTLAADLLAPLARQRAVELEVSADSGDFPARGDSARLRDAIASLLDNAVKFTPSGGKVTAQLVREDDRARVVVTDTGLGFSAAELADAFAPFRVVGDGQGRPAGGLGLSLALVRIVAELHRGNAFVRSEGRGRGSTFELQIPLTRAFER